MNSNPRRIIFDLYTPPANGSQAIYVYSDTPVVRLDEQADENHLRNEAQRAELPSLELPVADLIFGAALDWAYRGYIVHGLTASGEVLPPGTRPAQPIDHATRQAELQDIEAGESSAETDLPLYLFNVIVALEWLPSERFLQRLEWGFRRASDFLYDVTDGRMAFGQVIFGDATWLNGADIQIMASNRLLPRSWVSGLHKAEKYMPIRAGRGVWHKRNRVSIPWDEPEAFRTLVHEWGHYALELKDEYLEVRPVVPSTGSNGNGGGGVLSVQHGGEHRRHGPLIAKKDVLPRVLDRRWRERPRPATLSEPDERELVLPQISLPVESIMGTLEGTSEIIPQMLPGASGEERRRRVWQELINKDHFPLLDEDHQPLDGPDGLPLPLPRYHRLGLAAGAGEELLLDLELLPPNLRLDHCWVYILQGSDTVPQRLIAQGAIDGRAKNDGFLLLGARENDTIILVGERENYQPVVLRGQINGIDTEAGERWAEIAWASSPVTPQPPPLIDVIPQEVDPADRYATIKVKITPEPDRAWVFPFGQAAPLEVTEESLSVGTLDGHVLAIWPDGTLAISTYSQGGGPSTNIPVNANPTSAGSSEGNVLLFFQDNDPTPDYTDEERRERNGEIRVVTTLLYGLPNPLPSAAQARGYGFSLCSNVRLAPEFNSTLVMFFDNSDIPDNGELLIHRLVQNSWQPVPTYTHPGTTYAAAALNDADIGGTLTAEEEPAGGRIERYRLFWLPHA